MASAKVVVSEVQVHLFSQPSDLLGESDGLSRDAIIILPKSQVQSLDETGEISSVSISFPKTAFLMTSISFPSSLFFMT